MRRVGGHRSFTRLVVFRRQLEDGDLSWQIARDLEPNGLLAHLRCVPDSHVVSLFSDRRSCANPYRHGDPTPKAPITFAFAGELSRRFLTRPALKGVE